MKVLIALSGTLSSVCVALGGEGAKVSGGLKGDVAIKLGENVCGTEEFVSVSLAGLSVGSDSDVAGDRSNESHCLNCAFRRTLRSKLRSIDIFNCDESLCATGIRGATASLGAETAVTTSCAVSGGCTCDVAVETDSLASFDTFVFRKVFVDRRRSFLVAPALLTLSDVLSDGFDGPDWSVDAVLELESVEGEPLSACASPIPCPVLTPAHTPSATASAPIRPMCIA